MSIPFLTIKPGDSIFVLTGKVPAFLARMIPERHHLIISIITDAFRQQKALVFSWFAANIGAGLLEGVSIAVLYLAISVLLDGTANVAGDAQNVAESLGWLVRIANQMVGQFGKQAVFIGLIVIVAVSQIAQSGLSFCGVWFSSVVRLRVRRGVMRSVLGQAFDISFSEINRYKTGNIWTYMANAKGIEKAIGEVNSLIHGIVIAIVYCIALLLLSWEMTFAALIIMALLSVGLRRIMKWINMTAEESLSLTHRLNSGIADYLSGMRLIRSFGAEDDAKEVMHRDIDRSSELTLRSTLLNSSITPLVDVTTFITLSVALIGASMVLQDRFTEILPTILTFILVLFRLMPRIGLLNSLRARLNTMWPVLADSMEFLRKDNKEIIKKGGVEYNKLKDKIEFRDVSLSYVSGERKAVSSINFTIPKGNHVALVGESGSGKSSIMDMLIGLYEPTAGSIIIDGIDQKDLDMDQWRRSIGVVGQDTFLFAAAIRDNIAFAKPDATEEEIVRASRIAHAHDFIIDLENGYDTVLGNRGYRLSGGQCQRLALARAILRDPDVLILDEATSDLDSQSEKFIQDALDSFAKGRTIVSIAHRLSTIMKADLIIVLENGHIVEKGTHDELLLLDGHYSGFWNLQSAGEASASNASV